MSPEEIEKAHKLSQSREILREKGLKPNTNVSSAGFDTMANKVGKPSVSTGVLEFWPRALRQLAILSEKGWLHAPGRAVGTHRQVPTQEFINARARHLLDEQIEGPMDAKLGELHAACIAWNSLEVLERMLAVPQADAGQENYTQALTGAGIAGTQEPGSPALRYHCGRSGCAGHDETWLYCPY